MDWTYSSPEYFLSFANIINNAAGLRSQQVAHMFDDQPLLQNIPYPADGGWGYLWENGFVSATLHHYFLTHRDKFRYGGHLEVEPHNRISINGFALHPANMYRLAEVSGEDDEKELTIDLCVRHNLVKAVYNPFIVSHLSFNSQNKDQVVTPIILQLYKELAYNLTM